MLIARCTEVAFRLAFAAKPMVFHGRGRRAPLACACAAQTAAREGYMDALHHTTRTAAIIPAICSAALLACLVATPALAQQAAPAQGAAATPASEAHAAGTAPAPTRKRSGFGAAMAQLTQALRDASEQAAAPPADAAPAPARAEPQAAATEATATGGALAVESPP
ncbi:MAG TPA: hypothetical protein VNS59_02300 [Lysobacter sp.]|nr:hypothetical protein [Lysobacter sp.]